MFDIQLEGMEDIVSKIESLGKEGTKITNTALKKGAEIVKAAAKQEAPMQSGNLVDSIKLSNIKRGNNGTRYVWIGDVDGIAKYGWVHEFGSWKMSARPWLSTAYDRSINNVIEAMKNEFKRGLNL